MTWLVLWALLASCAMEDPYAESFKQIRLGQDSRTVIRLMGSPTVSDSAEIPLLPFVQHMVWRHRHTDYRITFVGNLVATKAVTTTNERKEAK
ncbi:MAG: hypothetical protein LBR88_08710 [Zoogloeaceae bacterium]|jgi:hypothetical protein|nr:hypothetical protein [Zoogloeaceae bacterium]